MKNINIAGTKITPTIAFNSDGILKLTGHSYPENATRIYEPLIEFVKKLESEKVELTIYLEYFNTSTSKYLQYIFRSIDANENISSAKVMWCYEEEDEEILEQGEMFEEYVDKCTFVYNEIKLAA